MVGPLRHPSVPSGNVPRDTAGLGTWLLGVRDFLRQLATAPFVWGNRVAVTFPSATTLNVAHGLGSPVTGWSVVRRGANCFVWENTAQNTLDPAKFIALTSNAAGTVTISFY